MTKSMTSGKPVKLILLFALPLIVGNIFQQFYSMADTVIVGRTIGVNALAAVGCTGSLSFFILGFVMGFTSGLSILIAQRFGAGDEEGIRCSFAAGIMLSVALTIVMTFLAVALIRPAMELLQTPEEILDDAVSYIRIIFWGIGASVLFNLGSNTGAGVATIFSQLLSGICCFVYIWKKMPVLRINRHHFHLAKKQLGDHLRVAFPMAFQMSIIAIGALILQFALNGLGAVSVAAYTAAQKIDSIATMPLNSLGQAMTTYTAQNYGAGQYERIKKGVFQCILISLTVSILMGLMNIFAGSNLSAIFVGSGEQDVIALSKTYLVINGSCYWVLGLLFIYRFTLQGLGNGWVPTVAGIMELIMRATAAIILVERLGFAGASSASPLAWIGACIPLGLAYHITIRKMVPKQTETAPVTV